MFTPRQQLALKVCGVFYIGAVMLWIANLILYISN